MKPFRERQQRVLLLSIYEYSDLQCCNFCRMIENSLLAAARCINMDAE